MSVYTDSPENVRGATQLVGREKILGESRDFFPHDV